MNKLVTSVFFFFTLVFTHSVKASSIPVDLNDFFADPTVTVATDGNSAILEEDLVFSSVLLSNDPFFGDPGISVPPALHSLSFNYTFVEPVGVGNDDEFFAWVFDGDTSVLIDEFLVGGSSAGTVTWDLSGLDPNISLLGLEFQLNALASDSSFDSFVEISNVHLETNSAPIPEPSSFFLLGTGLAGLITTLGLRRKHNKG